MRAQHALVDPLLTLGLPPAATMQTGADALAQAIGGVIVRNGNPGSVALGLEACVHVAAGLAPAVADGGDRAARVAAQPRQPAGRPGDEPVGLRRRPRARARPRRPAGAAARAERRPRAGRDARRRPGGLRGRRSSGWRTRSASRAGGAADGSRAVRAVRRLLAAIGFPTLRRRPACASGRRGRAWSRSPWTTTA